MIVYQTFSPRQDHLSSITNRKAVESLDLPKAACHSTRQLISARNMQFCVSHTLIGIEPMSTQIGGSWAPLPISL
jgi:hypothetical protein